MAKPRDRRGPTPRPDRGLRPVQDVIGRIRFDAALDVSRFTVGYEERFAGVREAPLAGVLGEGEVPWHRIWFIKAGSLVVWDRRERIDLILGSGASPAADLAAVLRACAPEATPLVAPARSTRAGAPAPKFVPQPCFRFDRSLGGWVAHVPVAPPAVAPESLQVVTYNVLFDLYEAEHIYSERRREACIALLRTRDADIIALQEVTPQLWAQLLATPWVQEGYYVSAGPDAAGLVPYGQALLSRWPLALEVHAFSSQKRLLVGRLALAGRSLAVAAVHLTSNHKADALEKRREQLGVLTQWLIGEAGDALVLGDFNFGDGDENPRLAAAGLIDAWQTVHPHHPGFTFDPVANPLAALGSRTGAAARYDRVLLYSPGRALAPIDITMFGDRPFADNDGQGLFSSDHFGLCCLLQTTPAPADPLRQTLASATPVHHSALVVLPPERLRPAIDAIRAAHDPSHGRWMPHINLVYGFVPEALFAAAKAVVEAVVRDHAPFRVHLRELRRFDHKGSTTVWLAPVSDPPGALEALQAALGACFPGCGEQVSRSGRYTAHLTVARLTGTEAHIAALVAQWQAQWRPLEFQVDTVHLISRRDEGPFEIRDSAPLGRTPTPKVAPATGPGVVASPAWSALPSPQHVEAARAVARACSAVLGEDDVNVHIVGSARLGVASPDADLDLVCAGPEQHDRFALFSALQDRLASDGVLTGGREVAGAGLALLRCRIGEIAVDLQYAGLPPSLHARGLAELDATALATLDDGSRRAALGCADADALMRLATVRAPVAVFQVMLRQVRAWARARQLDAGAWGLLGGYTWALLAGFAAHNAGPELTRDPDLLLRHFFALFAAWEPGRPVAFGPTPAATSNRRAPWPIYTPTPPSFNSARSLTRSTHELLRGELARAAALLGAGADLATLSAASDPPARRIVLALRAEDPADLATAAGWLEGQVLGLLLALERHGARVRPYPRAVPVAGGREHAIGVEGGGGALLSAAQAFTAEFERWIGRPPGASFTATLVQR